MPHTPAGGEAQDWLHSNAIAYSSADGDLLVSMRHQDWILKLDYRDGRGDGRVLWRLGQGGDFALTDPPPGDAFPWFSHQHGIELTADGRLLTFDNGNTRCAAAGPDCHSRGQIYRLDEPNRRATLIVDADLGGYSPALGWAQLLQNGDYAFTSGLEADGPTARARILELDPAGQRLVSAIQDEPEGLYRAYRLTTLYDGCCGVLASIAPVASPPAPRWNPWTAWGGMLTTAPAVVDCGGQLVAIVGGAGGALFAAPGTPSGLGPWWDLGGALTAPPTVACFEGALYAIVRSVDGALHVRIARSGVWDADWRALGIQSVGAPTVIGFGGRLYLVTRDADEALSVRSSVDGLAWSTADPLGGQVLDAPAAAVFQGRLWLFARGNNDALYMLSTTDGTTWTAWGSLAGVLTGAPAAVTWIAPAGGERLAVAVRGSDGSVSLATTPDGVAWTAWADLGGQIAGGPALASSDGALYLLARGMDDALYARIAR